MRTWNTVISRRSSVYDPAAAGIGDGRRERVSGTTIRCRSSPFRKPLRRICCGGFRIRRERAADSRSIHARSIFDPLRGQSYDRAGSKNSNKASLGRARRRGSIAGGDDNRRRRSGWLRPMASSRERVEPRAERVDSDDEPRRVGCGDSRRHTGSFISP